MFHYSKGHSGVHLSSSPYFVKDNDWGDTASTPNSRAYLGWVYAPCFETLLVQVSNISIFNYSGKVHILLLKVEY